MNSELFTRLKFPLIILSTLLLPLILGGIVPVEVKSFSLAISLSIKSILVFILPFIIFSFLFSSLIAQRNGAITFIILLLTMVFASNLTAIMTGYVVAFSTIPLLNLSLRATADALHLLPMWSLEIPKLISNEPAMVAGMVLGAIFAVYHNSRAEKIAKQMNKISLFILKKLFLPILPIFIIGFVFKLEYEKHLSSVLTDYLEVLVIVVSSQLTYAALLFMLAANFNPKKFFFYISNILPATFTGFSTISSAATMPVTIMCTEKNMHNSTMVRTILPATTNIHTLGSAFGITILALGTMSAFGMELPSVDVFLIFAFYYALAKFAVAGIPGGVILVVSPLLETYLGFSSEMIGLITALYILFDPFGTATNVTCNGAFAIIFNRIYKLFGKSIEEAETSKARSS